MLELIRSGIVTWFIMSAIMTMVVVSYKELGDTIVSHRTFIMLLISLATSIIALLNMS